MKRTRVSWAVLFGLWLLVGALGARPSEAMTVHPPGYSVSLFRNATGNVDIDIDAAGTFYLSRGATGIGRITEAGDSTQWSSAPATDLVLTPAGDGYAAGRGLCDCLMSIRADGSFSVLRQDTLAWLYVALPSDGFLYSTTSSISGSGLYRIDRSTGETTPVVLGGPGPGASGT